MFICDNSLSKKRIGSDKLWLLHVIQFEPPDPGHIFYGLTLHLRPSSAENFVFRFSTIWKFVKYFSYELPLLAYSGPLAQIACQFIADVMPLKPACFVSEIVLRTRFDMCKSGDKSGAGVQSLQRISPAQRTGIPVATGIYTQEVIATVREKRRLDI